MISQTQLEDRIFDYFNVLLKDNVLPFGFSTDLNERYLVDRQTNAPRVNDETVIYFRIESKKPMGRTRGSTRARMDRDRKSVV